jgi:hypothetical protein
MHHIVKNRLRVYLAGHFKHPAEFINNVIHDAGFGKAG